ncbi:type II CAAX prenyl endopeptidase Rce1 family protein [Halobacteriaceae archaeon GCM10025711]
MYAAFNWFVASLGFEAGYLAAFALYWAGWCLLLPAVVLGGVRGIRDLFREHEPRFGDRKLLTIGLLTWGPVVVFFVRFLPGVTDATVPVILVSVAVGVIIGVTEEVLWRGTFVRSFPESAWLGYVYPSVGFALWHVAPQSTSPNPMPGGVYSFILYSLLLGLSLGYYSWQTKSIRWATIIHVVHDSLGLPGFAWVGILTSQLP